DTPAMSRASGASRITLALIVLGLSAAPARGQVVRQRGSIEANALWFPQDAPNDTVNVVGDFIGREEIFLKPSSWIQFAGGLDVRENTHDQVETTWRLDFRD